MRVVVVLSLLVACGGHPFGKMITEISPSPSDPRLLLVKSCELIATGKADINGVKVGDCKRYGVRRSPIVPVPVSDARVLQREHRIVTGFIERPNGGAIVTTCRIGSREAQWALLDCADTEIATAPLETPDVPVPPPGAPPPPPPAGATP